MACPPHFVRVAWQPSEHSARRFVGPMQTYDASKAVSGMEREITQRHVTLVNPYPYTLLLRAPEKVLRHDEDATVIRKALLEAHGLDDDEQTSDLVLVAIVFDIGSASAAAVWENQMLRSRICEELLGWLYTTAEGLASWLVPPMSAQALGCDPGASYSMQRRCLVDRGFPQDPNGEPIPPLTFVAVVDSVGRTSVQWMVRSLIQRSHARVLRRRRRQ